MKTLTALPLLSLVFAAALPPATAQEWESLFDGQTLNGWKAAENQASFKVVDGTIACDGPRAHLFYAGAGGSAEFKNFELSVEIKTLNSANSGVFFHTEFQNESWPNQGFEVQVLNTRPTTGDYRENKMSGSLYGVRNIYKGMAKDGEWYTMTVSVRGKQVQTRINGTLLVDYIESSTPPASGGRGRVIDRGTFALQCHDPGSKAFYRNIRVKRLPDNLQDAPVASPPLTDYEKEIVRLGAENYPVVNYHVHAKGGLSVEDALGLSRQTGIFYGLAVNCGLNFAVTNDAGIDAYLNQMQGKPAFIVMQAEGREWVKMFSKEAISKFDYVFTDAMTIVDDSGRRMRLWIEDEVPPIADKQKWMDMLVDRTVTILSTEPVNLYVNPTYLPAQIAREYDQLWTEERMKKVAAAAAARGVAVEINAKSHLPSPAFLKIAKAAGCKFTFGTNNANRDVGRLDYCFEMVKELGLKWQDIWVPQTKAQ